jgi:hypothetical protein
MEQITTALLDEIELYLNTRVAVTLDGEPNQAMTLLMQIQDARATHDEDTIPCSFCSGAGSNPL